MNALTLIDGYKLDHRRQYPAKTEYVYSNWTPRGSRIDGVNEVTFFGLQYFLEEYLGRMWDEFFNGDIDEIADRYQRRVDSYLGPNDIGTDHIRALHALGYLPLEFRAVPEGSSVPLRVPMLTVENTHPDFGWLVNYMETLMSNVLWMPSTSATVAKRMRTLLNERAIESGASVDDVNFQGHDFSFRGMSGLEAACMSGAAHLISFWGTDTIPAIEFIEKYYPASPDTLIGASVAATEHSVMCAGGQDDERETYERLLDLYPGGILSVVSDTWDLWKVLTETVPSLKDKIMARDGKLVIRPDSGDPADILCGDPLAEPGTPQYYGVVQLLWDEFGGTINEAGYKVLDPHIGVIYGDSINFDRADDITHRLIAQGFASTNVVFGMGSYGYQFQTRDTFGFAMKATHVTIDGVGQNIFKMPVTDDGGKNSAKGRLAVIRDQYNNLQLVDEATPEQEAKSLLQPVWKDGKFERRFSFDEVRANAAK
jgi:nicotinamide phosphoribosyltransferase